MGKGIKKRHRLENQMRSQAEKRKKFSVIDRIAQEKVEKRRKNKEGGDIPASFRKLMALKAAAEDSNNAKKRRIEQRQAQQDQAQHPHHAPARDDSAGREADAAINASAEEDHQHASNNKDVTTKPEARSKVTKHAAPQQTKPTGKGLKSRKKEFLAQKKLRKKNKNKKDMTEKEEELADLAEASKPAFGEQAHQPISVNLKRRHWTDQEKTASERCKDVFLKQMQNAERMQAGQAPVVGRSTKAKKEAELERSRLQVIDAYRSSKRKNEEAPLATMQSLVKLVGS